MRPLLFFRLLLSALFAAIVFGNGIDDLAPVEITVIERANQNLCSCDISGNGDVMNVAKAQKVALHLAVIGIGRGIAEEEQKIYLVVRNAGCYLLRSAVFTEEESLDLKSGSVGYVLTCAACGTKGMAAECTAISDAKLCHQFLFLIISNNSYFHFNSLARQGLGLGAISFPISVGFLKCIGFI